MTAANAKTCAVALHPDGAPLRLALAVGAEAPPVTDFTHDAARTAALHLLDTLGIETRSAVTIGISSEIANDCDVHFILCRAAPPVRAEWKHRQPDGTVVTAHWVAFDNLPQNPLCEWVKATL